MHPRTTVSKADERALKNFAILAKMGHLHIHVEWDARPYRTPSFAFALPSWAEKIQKRRRSW